MPGEPIGGDVTEGWRAGWCRRVAAASWAARRCRARARHRSVAWAGPAGFPFSGCKTPLPDGTPDAWGGEVFNRTLPRRAAGAVSGERLGRARRRGARCRFAVAENGWRINE